MKTVLIAFTFLTLACAVTAQEKYFTRNGKVRFNASTQYETIEADNDKGTSVFLASTGQIEFAVLMKAFHFEKALMEEHFNENYVESTKFPKSAFKGSITNIKEVDFAKDGSYPIKLTGKLTLHGVTQDIALTAVMTVKNGIPSANVAFEVVLADYGISIPALVSDKVARSVKININASYEVMNP